MSSEKSHQHLFPSNTSSTNYKPRFVSIEGFNYKKINNETSAWHTSKETIINDSSRKIPLRSSSSNIIKSQMKMKKCENSMRRAKKRKRIELLAQPKSRRQTRTLKSASTDVADVKNENDNGRIDKSNIKDLPSSSHRFRAVTSRLLRLAQPKIHDSAVYDVHKRSIDSAKKTEVAKTSKRIAELAEPKKLQFHTSKDPFKVNPKALKASCSTRVDELARPKGFSQPFSQLLQYYLNRAFVEP